MPKERAGKRILRALNEVREWIEGENGETLKVHLPDGTVKDMTIEEYRRWRVRGDAPGADRPTH